MAVSEETRQQAQKALSKLPLYFVENKGQVDARVAYYLNAGNTTLYFTEEGLTYALIAGRTSAASPVERLRRVFSHSTASAAESRQRDDRQRWAVKLDFVGANPGVRPKGQDLHATIVNYFKGPRDQWHTGLKTYSTIVYENLWPGIDLVYSTAPQRLKYTFVVRPGADPNQIRLAYRGVANLRVNSRGHLEISTPVADFTDDRPYVYQDRPNGRTEVESAYDLVSDPSSGEHVYGFRLGVYDRTRALIVDPALMIYGGYIGGVSPDFGLAIAADSAGNAYVTGGTGSDQFTFPDIAGPDLTYNGSTDAFVAKVNAAGTALVYAGYIGGSGFDLGSGIALDGTGNAYVTGQTGSTESTFPVLLGPDLTHNGGTDAFVAKVNAAGTALVYAGYFGGAGTDVGRGIAVDGSGSAYVAGDTNSSGAGGFDAFVAKVSADGTAFVYTKTIGGIDADFGFAIAVDSSGNAYLAGQTLSGQLSFPVTVGPDLTHNSPPFTPDAFVAKLDASGTVLVYAGYIGGSGFDAALGIAVDSSGNAYVTGRTNSTQTTFPVTMGPDLTHNGGDDAFVAKVNAAGTGLVYAGYVGGSFADRGSAIAVDSSGNAYLAGETFSTESTFPASGAPDVTHNGGNDAFVAKVNAAGTALTYAGYIGGSGFADRAFGIAVDGNGGVYVVGQTNSSEATFPVAVGPDLTFNGFNDAFVVKWSDNIILASIDIKPKAFPNALPDEDPINLSSNGVTPVAIFTTADLDASTVAPASVTFAGAPAVRSSIEDADGDGDLDMVLHFDTQALDLTCASTQATLFGQAGSSIVQGTDTVKVLKDKNGTKCP